VPVSTVIVVAGSWLILLALTVAWLVATRDRDGGPDDGGEAKP